MRLSLDPIYQSSSVALVLVIAVVALLLWVTPSGTTPTRRRTLLLLRSLAAVALILPLIRPALVRTDNRPTVATFIIAADASRSMTLSSGELASDTGSKTRWDQQRTALTSLAKQLREMDDSLNVALYQYDQATSSLGSGPSHELSALVERFNAITPAGNLTDLATPLRIATDSSQTTPLAGIALISDGTQTATGDETTTTDASPIETARLIGAMGIPIWTIALGPETQTSTMRDVAVTSLNETYRLFSGNEAEITFEVSSQGYSGRQIPITLTWINVTGQASVAASRTVNINSNQETSSLRLPILAPEPGQYRLIVEAQSPSGESDTSNDRQLAFVDVRAGGGRVLYLEGTPRLEQMFLRRAVRRFPDLELSYRWIPRDTSKRWPIDLSDDLQSSRFDIVILGDLHSAALGKQQIERLAEMVGEGTALVTLGGEHAYGPGGYADTPLSTALPISLDGSITQRPGVISRKQEASGAVVAVPGQTNKPFQLQPTRPHPITTITAGETSWKTLPPMPGANVWPSVKLAPGVQVLLSDDKEQPMMVVGEFGKGRVASIAFDSTWTWWRGGANEFHRRFWRQLMLWLLSREESDDNKIQIEMTPRRFVASQGSEYSASTNSQAPFSPPDKPTPSTTLIASIELEDGTIRNLETNTSVQASDQSQTVRVTGTVSNDLPPGIHTLKVTDKNSPETTSSIPFQVIDDTRELIADKTDHAFLNRLASATSAAGGEAFRTDQVEQLVERITNQRRRAERTVIEKKRLGDDPVTGWLLFILFAGALSTEWYLRRQWGLA